MSESPAESPGILWNITLYVFIAIVAVFATWLYFRTPVEYASQTHTGSAMETKYQVQVARFPSNAAGNADWHELTAAIQDRLDELEQTMSDTNQFDLTSADWFHELKLAIPELERDFSSIIRGLAVDSIAELLEKRGITDYFIEVGTLSRSKGKKGVERDQDWVVGIERPTQDYTGLYQTFALNDRSLAKSGTRELASVAVLAPNALQASAWMTAMLVLGEQEGLELANRHGIAVLFLRLDGDEVRTTYSEHWQQH